MVKLVVFDLDGTLVDTISDITDTVNRSLEEIGFTGDYEIGEIKHFIGSGVDVLLRKALEKHSKDEVYFKLLKTHYLKNYSKYGLKNSHPYPGIISLLQKLKVRKIKLAVLSNKPNSDTRLMIEKLFTNNCFDIVYGCQSKPKPDPQSLFEILEVLNIEKKDAILVGDSFVDYETGENAAIKTVLVTYGFTNSRNILSARGYNNFIDSPLELLQLIEE